MDCLSNFFKNIKMKYGCFFLCGLVLIGISLVIFGEKSQGKVEESQQLLVEGGQDEVKQKAVEENSEEPTLYVDLKGAVKKPGLYKIDSSMRLLDLVEQAGGFLEQAETKSINYAQKLSDQMVVYIPTIGEENLPDIASQPIGTNEGRKKAEEIVRYREEKGSFQSVEKIQEVNGIGQKIYEQLKEEVSI